MNNRFNLGNIFVALLLGLFLTAVGYGFTFAAYQFALGALGPCTDSDFNLIFKYGVGAKNVLNTFQGTYTRDMVVGPPIPVRLCLSEKELDNIYQKMVEIDFFGYPDKFHVLVLHGGVAGRVTPYSTYYFKVKYNNSEIKELVWADNIISEDERADNLRELIKFIIEIIESKPGYKRLPEPRGGYC